MLYIVTTTTVDTYEVDAPDAQAAIDLVLEGDPSVRSLDGYTEGVAKEVN